MHKRSFAKSATSLIIAMALGAICPRAFADQVNLTINSADAIFLAGRTDVTIAPPGAAPSGYPLVRNTSPSTGVETFPQSVAAASGQSFQFSVTGSIDYNGTDVDGVYGPDGVTSSTSNLNAVGGISGYYGPAGGFVGVFLTNANPQNGTAPATLNFTGGNTSFPTLYPLLGQVFFIGDGLTSTSTVQTFYAPTGATRLFLGIQDGRFFTGTPGAYDDNVGSLAATITTVPEPASLALLAVGGTALLLRRRRH